ncbi:type II toxin-antitoxin system PemK/MazF family toxin [Candidatus Woesearchaeota archaeon]|nr:type II toxin-antitoxin system PemK/MazF family toxin [Candidatus Woesearchaeota archaeon]
MQALRFPHTLEVRPSKTNALSSISIALLFQVRAIDKRRLMKKIGSLEEKTLKEIDEKLRKILSL